MESLEQVIEPPAGYGRNIAKFKDIVKRNVDILTQPEFIKLRKKF